MPRTIRFHLDENSDPAIAAGLRRYGIDVTHRKNWGCSVRLTPSSSRMPIRRAECYSSQRSPGTKDGGPVASSTAASQVRRCLTMLILPKQPADAGFVFNSADPLRKDPFPVVTFPHRADS